MANLAGFKTLLSSYADSKHSLPGVELSQVTELGQAFKRIVTLDNAVEGETDGEKTGRYVDEICASFADETNADAVRVFDETVEGFTQVLKDAYASLSSIREKSHELAEAMDRFASEYIEKNQYVVENRKNTEVTEDFPTFSWDGAKVIGAMSYVIEAVNGLVTNAGEVKKELDASLFNIVVSNLDKYAPVAEIAVEDDAFKATVETLKELCADESAEAVEEAYNYILGAKDLSDIKTILSSGTKRLETMFQDILTVNDFVVKVFPIADVIATEQVKVEDKIADRVKANAKSITTLCEIATYHIQLYRTTLFGGSVVLQGGLINEDLWESYVEKGGTKKNIGYFVYWLFGNDVSKIPVVGIKPNSLLGDDFSNIIDKVERKIATIKQRIALETTRATVAAYCTVIVDYVRKKVERDNPNADAGAKSALVAGYSKVIDAISDDIRQYGVAFFDAALATVVKLDYAGTFVEHLQKQLGAAYLAKAKEATDLSDEALKQIDVSVISRLVAEFVCDKMLQTSPGLVKLSTTQITTS